MNAKNKKIMREICHILAAEVASAFMKRDGMVFKKIWVGVWINQCRMTHFMFENLTMEEAVARARALYGCDSVASQMEMHKMEMRKGGLGEGVFYNPFGPHRFTENQASTEFFASTKYRESCTIPGIEKWRGRSIA